MPFGLALFYGGMVRKKNAVATIYKTLSATFFVSLGWVGLGYSMAFSASGNSFIGGLDHLFAADLMESDNQVQFHYLNFLFQMGFAVLAPSIMIGSIVERVNLHFWLFFSFLWSLLVYSPVAYWTWNPSGFLHQMGVLDFAGGNVVHMTSGFSAVTLAILIGRRKDFFGFRKSFNLPMVFVGTALLWLGWFGFNAGSSSENDMEVLLVLGNTFLCVSGAFVGWFIIDMLYTPHRPTLLGAMVSTIAGLVAITPAANMLNNGQSILLGLITGLICHFSLRYYRAFGRIDDSLEVFITHGLSAVIGATGVGLMADKGSLKVNMIVVIVTIAWSVLVSIILFKLCSLVFTPRVNQDKESVGLDKTFHGEDVVFLED
jgi:Amt family ammonium transporter